MLGAQGLAGVQPQSHSKAGEHPQGYQTETQPRAPLALSPTITPVTLRPDSKRVLNEIQGKGPNRHTGGLGGGGRNSTLLEQNALTPRLPVQHTPNVGTRLRESGIPLGRMLNGHTTTLRNKYYLFLHASPNITTR